MKKELHGKMSNYEDKEKSSKLLERPKQQSQQHFAYK